MPRQWCFVCFLEVWPFSLLSRRLESESNAEIDEPEF